MDTARELESITNATIPQGKGEPVAQMTLGMPPELPIRSDSPDPIRLKDQLITMTKAYLLLDKQTPPMAADAAERLTALADIKAKFAELRAAMALARGEDAELTRVRAQFEKFIGVKATTGAWPQGHNGLNKMATNAMQMLVESKLEAQADATPLDAQLRALEATNPGFMKDIGEKLGTDINVGFAGAVSKEFESVINALKNGSMVQKCQTLNAFAENWMTVKVKANDKMVMARIRANIIKTQAEMAEEAKKQNVAAPGDFRLGDRLENMKSKGFKGLAGSPEFMDKMEGPVGPDGKRTGGLKGQNSGSPTVPNSQNVDKLREAQGGPLLNKSKASSDNTALGGDMDTKMAQQPIELLEEHQLDFLANQGSPRANFEEANRETDAVRRKAAKVAALKAVGIFLSKAPGTKNGSTDGEALPAHGPGNPKDNNAGMVDATSIVEDPQRAVKDQVTVNSKPGQPDGKDMTYIEGKAENIVDPMHTWIDSARKAMAPLKAGISGTTARFAGSAQMLGATKGEAVIAMLGHLQEIEAHSFWEIVDGAGLGMTVGTYTPFSPNPDGMETAGTEFANKHVQNLGPDDAALKKKAILGQK